MKILAMGAKGQLGWELLKQGPKIGFEMLPGDLPELDITNFDQMNVFLERCKPSLLINAAAYTNVDQAETDKDKAYAVNRDGAAVLARLCNRYAIPLIHISTDFVFDGHKKQPYIEADLVAPLGVYAQSKVAGDSEVRIHLGKHIIIRTAWLYGVHGPNFVKTMLRLAAEKDTLRVVADQYGCPTSASDLAGALLTIAMRIRDNTDIQWGTYHYCGKGVTTWFGFAEKIIKIAETYGPLKVAHVAPIATDAYPVKAVRPPYSALDCSLIEKCFGISPRPWQDSLKETLDRILFKA